MLSEYHGPVRHLPAKPAHDMFLSLKILNFSRISSATLQPISISPLIYNQLIGSQNQIKKHFLIGDAFIEKSFFIPFRDFLHADTSKGIHGIRFVCILLEMFLGFQVLTVIFWG